MALVAVKVKLMPLVKLTPIRLSGCAPTFFSSMNSKSSASFVPEATG